MIVMDQYTRRIVGLAVHAGVLDGPGGCRLLNRIFATAIDLPRALSTDHDPLFEFHRWKANLRILEITEFKSTPLVPMSHPFVERLVGTIRRESITPWAASRPARGQEPNVADPSASLPTAGNVIAEAYTSCLRPRNGNSPQTPWRPNLTTS